MPNVAVLIGAMALGLTFALFPSSAGAQVKCPSDCSGQGQCQPSGQCQCNAGWQGAACSIDGGGGSTEKQKEKQAEREFGRFMATRDKAIANEKNPEKLKEKLETTPVITPGGTLKQERRPYRSTG